MQRVQNPRPEKENEPVRRPSVSKGAGSLQWKKEEKILPLAYDAPLQCRNSRQF